jgi:hypothetical protein
MPMLKVLSQLARANTPCCPQARCSKPTHKYMWLLMHHQGPQHCRAKCWLVSFLLRGATACPMATACPAASSSTHLLPLLQRVEGHRMKGRAHSGNGTGAGAHSTGGRRWKGRVRWLLAKQHSMHAMLKVLLSMAKQLARIMRPCCYQASMQQTNALGQVGAHASLKVPSIALYDTCWSAFCSGVRLHAQRSQRALLPLAAPICWVCCGVLRSAARGHRARWGKAQGQGQKHRRQERTGQDQLVVAHQHSTHAAVPESPEHAKQMRRARMLCCYQASMQQTNAETGSCS